MNDFFFNVSISWHCLLNKSLALPLMAFNFCITCMFLSFFPSCVSLMWLFLFVCVGCSSCSSRFTLCFLTWFSVLKRLPFAPVFSVGVISSVKEVCSNSDNCPKSDVVIFINPSESIGKRWFGHLTSMSPGCFLGEVFRACPNGKRSQGRPRMSRRS